MDQKPDVKKNPRNLLDDQYTNLDGENFKPQHNDFLSHLGQLGSYNLIHTPGALLFLFGDFFLGAWRPWTHVGFCRNCRDQFGKNKSLHQMYMMFQAS